MKHLTTTDITRRNNSSSENMKVHFEYAIKYALSKLLVGSKQALSLLLVCSQYAIKYAIKYAFISKYTPI